MNKKEYDILGALNKCSQAKGWDFPKVLGGGEFIVKKLKQSVSQASSSSIENNYNSILP